MSFGYGNYNRFPEIKVANKTGWQGYQAICEKIRKTGAKRIVVDCYPGVDQEEIKAAFLSWIPEATMIETEAFTMDSAEIEAMVKEELTDDRVFARMTLRSILDFYRVDAAEQLENEIAARAKQTCIIIGVGASLFVQGDLHIYADLARWEIQMRYRKGMGNWLASNGDEDGKRKYKRGFFLDWRIADRHKKRVFGQVDYFLDTNEENDPKMVAGEDLRAAIKKTAEQPFRVVPYFDPGVWGGQWMKQVCGLDPEAENYAWSFDGVPEENSLYYRFDNLRFEIPAIDLVFQEPRALLGEKVHARFGTEFPIRFDFLDTMQGQNLSLQVHPLTEYIQEKFGMAYTQDESYYMLETGDDATVYLGIKEDVKPAEMMQSLRDAQDGKGSFPAEDYINCWPAKKHDHFLIPAGTIHCSGTNAMVLEISATPYIFTFKLWDWDRVGLDGHPRPIHLDHGEQVIQWDRRTEWVEKELINQFEVIEEGEGWLEERTGLHEREFIETRRHRFSVPVTHHTNGGVNVLNLVEGAEAIVESPTQAFEPFVVHYAETFMIPAAVGEYVIRPYGKSEGKEIMTMKAFVRN